MIWALVITSLILLLLALYLASLSRHQKSARGDLQLTGRQALVEKQLQPEGTILVRGEIWQARSRTGEVLATDSVVRIVGAQDHLLIVDRDYR